MLLRRITKHVREQNWFALGLEFVVVVVGVYLGLQADAWNENRKERVREKIAMEQLLADFTANSELATQMADFHKDKVEELTFAMNALTRGELAESDEARFRNAFVSMFQLPPPGISMGGYEAITRFLKACAGRWLLDLTMPASMSGSFWTSNRPGTPQPVSRSTLPNVLVGQSFRSIKNLSA